MSANPNGDLVVQPWERQPYETQGTFAMFQEYMALDYPRSVHAAYRAWRLKRGEKEAHKIKRAPGSWFNVSTGKTRAGKPIDKALTWEQRGAAFDDYVAAMERQKWVDRKLLLIEKEWSVGSSLLEKGEQMLMFPIVAQSVGTDGKTIIAPANWNMKDIAPLVAQGSKLARLATGMSTENVTVEWREEAKKVGLEPDVILRKLVDEFKAKLG